MVKVLVVDDSALDRRLAGKLLERAGFEPTYAENGMAALDLCKKDPPDIAVTDMQMPEMDGLELVQQMRTRFPRIPVILMTAHGSEDLAASALQKGAASYVPKRSLVHALASTVGSVRELAEATGASRRVLASLEQLEFRFRLDNDVQEVPPIIGFLEANLSRVKAWDETTLIQVGVALREALVNAMFHGNLEVSSELRENDGKAFHELAEARKNQDPYKNRRVSLVARETRSEITYVIADEGPGFDPTALPDPTDPSQLERVSGRGLLLIRMFMDETWHNAKGNEITLIKRCC